MTSIQLLLAMGVPTIMVLIGILLNRSDVMALRGEMVQLRNDMQRDLTTLRNDLHRDMTSLRTDLQKEMVTLRDNIHRDMVGLHERVAVVESKQDQ